MRIIRFILQMILPCLYTGVSCVFAQNNTVPFRPGEQIQYKIHYGFVNAAEAVMKIQPQYELIDGEECYSIVVQGRTAGMFDLFMRVRDEFGTYLDKDLLVPRKFYRKIEEGRYRKHEVVDFDVENKKATVRNYSDKKKKWKEPKEFEISPEAQDLVSGYYYLRTVNFDNYIEGDTIQLKVFFDDESTIFKMLYVGKETLKTKIGKYRALIISPIMPENSLFDGEDAIRVWLSDDKDKIPLKVKAKMFIGALEIDIKKFKRGAK